MVRHHVMVGLSRYFQVLWMNPAVPWRETVQALGSAESGKVVASPSFSVYSPDRWLPLFYSPRWLARLTSNLRVRRARQWLKSRGCTKILLYLWNPQFESSLSAVDHDLSCYHLEDEYSYSPVELPLDPIEARVLTGVDQVFMLSPALYEKKAHLNPNTQFAPGGVNFAEYSRPVSEPADLAKVPHPRIGYVGSIKKQLDWNLLKYLITNHPDWSFVFLGPKIHDAIDEAVSFLSSRSNVYFLGGKATAEMPLYPQHFDVCIMPYTDDGYTKFIYPLKLHEYLAAGRPTVGTPIRSLQDFSDVVALPRTPEEWSKAIADALEPAASSSERCAARQAVARRYDWHKVVHRIAEVIANRLGKKIPEMRSSKL